LTEDNLMETPNKAWPKLVRHTITWITFLCIFCEFNSFSHILIFPFRFFDIHFHNFIFHTRHFFAILMCFSLVRILT
jgi:hypothetical protein